MPEEEATIIINTALRMERCSHLYLILSEEKERRRRRSLLIY
jgi:hypothetical protein